MKKIVTFGTFDIFHQGHLEILRRASTYGDELIVGISSDSLNYNKKQRYPVYSQKDRMEIISSLGFVNRVFLEESLELKREYLLNFEADCLVMGCDWTGKFDEFNDICEVIYLPRTPNVSTTEIIEKIKQL